MSNADNTSQIATYLDSLESALDNGEPADVLAFLRVLRMNGLDDRQSAQLVESFSNDPQPADFERVRQWLDNQRQQLDSPPPSNASSDSFDDIDLFGDDDFVSVDDGMDGLDELEDDDGFVSVEEESDFEDIELNLDSSPSSTDDSAFDDIDFGDQSDEEFSSPPDDSDEINWGPSPGDGDDSESEPEAQSDHGSFPPSEELHVDDLYDFDDTPSTETTDSQGSQQTQPEQDEVAPEEPPGSFPPSEEFQFDEPYGVDPTPVPAAPEADDDASAQESPESDSDSDPFGSVEDADDSFFGADSTPMPQSHRETGDESSAAIEQSLESTSSSTSTGEFKAPGDSREKTRQFDAAQLQALSDATSSAVADGDSEAGLEPPDADFALGSSISSPLEDYGLESKEDELPDDTDDPHQRRTRQQFKAPGQISEDDDVSNPEPTPQSDSADNFDFGLDESSLSDDSGGGVDSEITPASSPNQHAQQDSDDFDFEFGPDNSSGPDDNQSSGDFDFDLGPESSPSTDDNEDSDDFDFDLGPESSSGADETSGDDFDSDPFGSAPEAAVEDMDYATPPDDDDSFFPPPIDGGDAESDSSRSNTPSPFPESPSAADAPTSPGTPNSGETPLPDESAQRSRQPTPRLQDVDAETLRQSQATPARGTSPPSSGASEPTPTPPPGGEKSDTPLPDDEFLALGEELSASDESASSPPSEPPSSTPPKSRSESTPGYRGEPMVAPSSAETPAPQDSNSQPPTGVFESKESSGNEDTNPFAHEAPTGVRDEPMDAVEQSSFVLEEVDDQADVEDPEAAIDATLQEARNLYEDAEFEQAMELVEAVLEVDGESERARQLETQLESELERLYADELGSLMHTPSLSVSMAEVANLDLDHRAGFLISQIDGLLTFEDILDMSSMSRLETLTVLTKLYREDIISID